MGLSRILIHLPVNILALVLAAAGQHIGHPLHLSAVVFEETADHAAAPPGPHRGTDDDQPVIFQLSFRFKGQNVRAVFPHGVHAAAEPAPQAAPLHAVGQSQQLRVHFFGDGLHHPFGIPRSGIVNAEYIPHVFTSVSYASPAASLSSSQRRYRASSSAWAASLSATSALSFS